MNKPFLLIVGDQYYPSSGTGDWRGCFKSIAEAEIHLALKDPSSYDWYRIVDLRDWVNA